MVTRKKHCEKSLYGKWQFDPFVALLKKQKEKNHLIPRLNQIENDLLTIRTR